MCGCRAGSPIPAICLPFLDHPQRPDIIMNSRSMLVDYLYKSRKEMPDVAAVVILPMLCVDGVPAHWTQESALGQVRSSSTPPITEAVHAHWRCSFVDVRLRDRSVKCL